MKLPKIARHALTSALAATLLIALPARAQVTAIKFQLDWRFEGPAAMFLVPLAKGYFKAKKLDVTVDAATAQAARSRAWPPGPTTWGLPTSPR